RKFLQDLTATCGTKTDFRVSETPCFLPRPLMQQMSDYGRELTEQLVNNQAYRKASDAAVPAAYNVANESALPMFLQVDFGVVCDATGELQPKLVELQAFPSLYGYQPTIARQYLDSYKLPDDLRIFFGHFDEHGYWQFMRNVIVADCDPEDTVLLEIDPFKQKTLPDFLITQKQLDIAIVDIRDVIKQGKRLFYRKDGQLVAIERIYNRCIVDELVRKNVNLPFDFRDDLDVQWAGHPNWYFRLSKFSIPHLK